MSFFDTHSHIIPAVDDGPETIDKAAELLEIYKRKNITDIICTPHIFHGLYENNKESILQGFQTLKKLVEENFPEITIYPASEVMAYVGLEKDLKTDKILTVNDNRKFVFIELPLSGFPNFIDDLLFRIEIAGVIPILSHPERYSIFIKDPLKAFSFTEKEILFQMNSGSILGRFGKHVTKTAEFFLKHKLVHFVGTDTHSIDSRYPDLPEAFDRIRHFLNEEELDIIFSNNPQALVGNGKMKYLPQVPYVQQKKQIFSFFKKIIKSE